MGPPGDRTHYGTIVSNCNLPRMWAEVHESADVAARRADVAAFNAGNRYRKRGLAVLPTLYGINFGLPFLNQGGALVMIYGDGSVLVSHGGVEMGQGLHTKAVQVRVPGMGGGGTGDVRTDVCSVCVAYLCAVSVVCKVCPAVYSVVYGSILCVCVMWELRPPPPPCSRGGGVLLALPHPPRTFPCPAHDIARDNRLSCE